MLQNCLPKQCCLPQFISLSWRVASRPDRVAHSSLSSGSIPLKSARFVDAHVAWLGWMRVGAKRSNRPCSRWWHLDSGREWWIEGQGQEQGQRQRQGQGKKRIPSGNDRQKGKGKGGGNGKGNGGGNGKGRRAFVSHKPSRKDKNPAWMGHPDFGGASPSWD